MKNVCKSGQGSSKARTAGNYAQPLKFAPMRSPTFLQSCKISSGRGVPARFPLEFTEQVVSACQSVPVVC